MARVLNRRMSDLFCAVKRRISAQQCSILPPTRLLGFLLRQMRDLAIYAAARRFTNLQERFEFEAFCKVFI